MDYPIFIIDQLTQQLQALRKSRGWSQAELAKRLGVSQARVATIERNPAVVGVGQVFEILQLLGVQLVLRNLSKPTNAQGVDDLPDTQPTPALDDGHIPKGEW